MTWTVEFDRRAAKELRNPDRGAQGLRNASFKKKLKSSILRPAVEADLEWLHLFGATQLSGIERGLGPRVDRLIRNVASLLDEGEDPGPLVEIVTFVARKYPKAWLAIADLASESGTNTVGMPSPSVALQAYIEACPNDSNVWYRLAGLHQRAGNYLGQVNALLRAVEVPETAFEDISRAVDQINRLLREHHYKDFMDSDEKRLLIATVRDLMATRIQNEGSGSDYSRLAWLCLHLRDQDAARKYTDLGLQREPENYHLHNLDERMPRG